MQLIGGIILIDKVNQFRDQQSKLDLGIKFFMGYTVLVVVGAYLMHRSTVRNFVV